MKKFWMAFCFLAVFSGANANAFYYDFIIEETPAMIVAPANSLGVSTNQAAYYTFFNALNLKATANFSDDFKIVARGKDTFISMTNASILMTNRNRLYLDRAYLDFYSDEVSVKAGRALFVEGNGLLLGNVADGLSVRTSFLSMNQRLFAAYSGFLPSDLNEFNANLMDVVEGGKKLTLGLSLEKIGWGMKSLSVKCFYTTDLSDQILTNATTEAYTFSLGLEREFGSDMSLSFDGFYEMGTAIHTNGIDVDLSAFAFDLSFVYILNESLGFLVSGSYASGEDGSGKFNRFSTFGYKDTGYVLIPEFANLLMAKAGAVGSFMENELTATLFYYYFRRNSAADSVQSSYDGSGSTIGHEISASVEYDFDPNIGVFLDGGFFMKGDAFSEEESIYKLIGGLTIKL